VTSSRRLSSAFARILAFRYLAGGAAPDHWTLNDFRRRHARGLNDLFTARGGVGAGQRTGPLGPTWPSTRRASRRTLRGIASTLSPRCATRGRAFGGTFAVGRSSATRRNPNEGAGNEVGASNRAAGAATEEIPARLERLQKAGLKNSRAAIRTAVFCASGRVHAGLHGHAGGQ